MELPRIHLEPIGGIAGDMFVAAVADAFPEHRAALMAQLCALTMPVAASARFEPHRGATLIGTRFVVEAQGAGGEAERRDAPPPSRSTGEDHHAHHEQGHRHEPTTAPQGHHDHSAAPRNGNTAAGGSIVGYHRHGHISHAWIVQWLRQAELSNAVRQHALDIFVVLAEAEAAVHGVPVHEVEFHEVGSWDSIVDIVAAAFLIDAVGPATWTHGPLPLGGGTVATAHGAMPVPAPATLYLLRGMAVVDDGVRGERVTPTGAAILKHLARSAPSDARGPSTDPMLVGANGLGFGARSLPDRPNALRCTQFLPVDAAGDGLAGDAVDCIEFEIDDQPAEDLAIGLDRLREHGDVLQVFQIPVFGKKGRLASRIHVLARAGTSEAVSRACFVETTTIGLRCQRLERRTLSRAESSAVAGGAAVRVKVCERPGAATAKAEMDDLAHQAGGHAGREQVRRDAERQALASRPTPVVRKKEALDEH